MKRIVCSDCMFDSPYWYCCRLQCGEHEFCRNCKAECRKYDGCPNVVVSEEGELIKERDENGSN